VLVQLQVAGPRFVVGVVHLDGAVLDALVAEIVVVVVEDGAEDVIAETN
jgi:hypothetical protein